MTAEVAAKAAMNDQFSRIGRALASGHRIEVLDLLAQGERSVDSLARIMHISTALASSHLQVLRAAGLVGGRRSGKHVFYRLAGDDVYDLLARLRGVAQDRLADVSRAVAAYLAHPDETEPITRAELWARAKAAEVTILDVRPREEYAAGHIPASLSMPFDVLRDRIDELPPDQDVIAYCRGPYCLLAPAAVRLLHAAGRPARRLEDGFPEWRIAGYPVEAAAG